MVHGLGLHGFSYIAGLFLFVVLFVTILMWIFLRLHPCEESTPNQSSEPALSSVTPPAGQEARPR
jgi:hypothetical protein